MHASATGRVGLVASEVVERLHGDVVGEVALVAAGACGPLFGDGEPVIDVAAGDLGSSAARKFDIEAWIPTQGAYRELTSTSNCTTFQARRLQTRFRTESGKTEPVATLNGTLATTRWLVALLETHQQADGSVIVPEALRPYVGGLDILTPVGA